MALLSLAAQVQETDNFRDLIIAVEEPELYQHPPQTRYLSAALQELARSKTQMLVTTHSPYFVNGAAFDGIKLLQKFKNSVHIQTNSLKRHAEEFSRIKNVKEIGGSAFLSGMDKTLETSAAEMFFGRKIVFVESVEDIAIIESYLINTKKWIDFLRAGGHFIAAFGKPKMPYLIALAHSYKIEHYTVFDIDLDKKNSPNDEIIRFSKISPHHLPDTLTAEFNNECYYGFEHDIQKSILRDHPSWHPIREQIANEWGWSLERMDKDPMLLRAAVDKLFETDGDIKPLAQLAQRLENFWAK